MELLVEIFLMFAKLSLFAFGGGYVMFPMLLKDIETNQLLSTQEITDVIAIAGMSPGAVAVNAAVGTGFKVTGNIWGVIAAFLGIAIPCALIVILVATFFFKVYNNTAVKNALYGLRPVITAIIINAAVNIAAGNHIIAAKADGLIAKGIDFNMGGHQIFEVKSICLAVISFLLLVKTKIHPIFIIIGSGVLGILLF